jgi:hypothetical protein
LIYTILYLKKTFACSLPLTTKLKIKRDMNGFSEKLMQTPQKIEKIELVLEDIEKMSVLKTFTGIKSLTLINCGIV